jgi:thiol-disulfide isomerase/thioredoxin
MREKLMNKQSNITTALAAALCVAAFSATFGVADEQATTPKLELVDAQRAAPNFIGIDNWVNSVPLNIADLRGKVVLVDFWTYGCYNCVNTLPHVTRLYDTYRSASIHRSFHSRNLWAICKPPSSAMGSAIRSRRTMSTPRGTPIETNIGRRNTLSTRAARLSSSTPARASTTQSSGL